MDNNRYTSDETRFENSSSYDSVSTRSSHFNRNGDLKTYIKAAILIFAFATIFIFRAFVIERIVVQGDSMNPTYSNGDVMWARKYNVRELERNQVVIVKIDGVLYIKRVIGLPNEKVMLEDGFVYVNGECFEDKFGYQTSLYGGAFEEIELGENQYFLLGDNRDDSADSRIWGAVDIDDITGVVFLKFFPFWEIECLQ